MWKKLAGDAQWKEFTSDCFRSNPDKGFFFAFDPLTSSAAEILDVIAETAAALTKEELRRFTFSTYSYLSGGGNPAFFRSYVNDSAQLNSIRRLEPGSVINLGGSNPLPQSWIDMQKCAPQIKGADEMPPEITPVLLTATETAPFSVVKEQAHLMQPSEGGEPQALKHKFQHQAAVEDDSASASEEHRNNWLLLPLSAIVILLCLIAFFTVLTSNQKDETENNPDPSAALPESVPHEKDEKAISGKQRKFLVPPITSASLPSSEKTSGRLPSPEPVTVPKREPVAVLKRPPVAGPKQAPIAVPKTAPITVLPATKAVPKQKKTNRRVIFSTPSQRHVYNLYLSVFRGQDYKLPESLRSAVSLELVLKSAGGMSDIADLKQFVKGNGTSTVAVYARKRVDSQLMTEWKPDHTPSGQMTFQLTPDKFLRIRLPQSKVSGVPGTSDIAQIAFVSRQGKKVSFDVTELPAFIDRMLNSSLEVSLEFYESGVRFLLNVPDDLWTLRSFYNISVKGRNLGGINNRRITLHELDLYLLQQTIEKRNSQLRQLREAEKQLKEFDLRYESDLQFPPLQAPAVLDGITVEALKSAAAKDDDTWESRKKIVEDKLEKAIKKKNLSEAECDSFMKTLDEFRQAVQTFEARKKAREQHWRKVGECKLRYDKANAVLEREMKNVSPALYEEGRKKMMSSGAPVLLDTEFFRKIECAKLIEEIKIEIIRKVR